MQYLQFELENKRIKESHERSVIRFWNHKNKETLNCKNLENLVFDISNCNNEHDMKVAFEDFITKINEVYYKSLLLVKISRRKMKSQPATVPSFSTKKLNWQKRILQIKMNQTRKDIKLVKNYIKLK